MWQGIKITHVRRTSFLQVEHSELTQIEAGELHAVDGDRRVVCVIPVGPQGPVLRDGQRRLRPGRADSVQPRGMSTSGRKKTTTQLTTRCDWLLAPAAWKQENH